jgi:hypothetical protein
MGHDQLADPWASTRSSGGGAALDHPELIAFSRVTASGADFRRWRVGTAPGRPPWTSRSIMAAATMSSPMTSPQRPKTLLE